MNYKEVIIPEKIEEYKKQHKLFYQSLSSMIFDISFIEACCELQDADLDYDLITIKFLYRDLFENLISKVYRCFFDNSGANSINLFNYKNNVIGAFLKSEYKQTVIEQIALLPIEDVEYKKQKDELGRNVFSLRREFIAHRLLSTSDTSQVDLKDIKKLVEYGCQLFQTLSFEPRDFYSFFEGDGNDFSKEFKYTYESTRRFIKNSYLSSKYITNINCQISEECDETIKKRIESIVNELNSTRSQNN